MHTSIRADERTATGILSREDYDSGNAFCDDRDPEATPEKSLVILDSRTLDRECLTQCLRARGLEMDILAFGSMDEWRARRDALAAPSAVLFNLGGRRCSDPGVAKEIGAVASEFRPAPVVVLADSDELAQILKALECGAKGYIPTSTGVGVCMEAVNLAMAGGIFVPASSVLAMRKVIDEGAGEERPFAGMFTQRQEEVIRALRRGKANKIIAYELNLRESTVKVHIRNIMKKLKATNRTEVAYKLSEMFPN
ncbi:response regulator transcription factor [Chelativorans intermedius]|uniref:LuxR C-terminal-related transcriptional regulator n=1 Tax=Chelativorans intermedius TaxID=515947 RepID=A0ABV6D695_9HYPH|nr:response regulator transcription factor [Chelativorans intermedius]MCT8999397.1 response regulator transcription factor [Chelativorans intermedius]